MDLLIDAFAEYYGKRRGTSDFAIQIVVEHRRSIGVTKEQIWQYRHDHPRKDRQ